VKPVGSVVGGITSLVETVRSYVTNTDGDGNREGGLESFTVTSTKEENPSRLATEGTPVITPLVLIDRPLGKPAAENV
jgi:hypothetical protein